MESTRYKSYSFILKYASVHQKPFVLISQLQDMFGLNTLLGKHCIARKGDDKFCLIGPFRKFSASRENDDLAR